MCEKVRGKYEVYKKLLAVVSSTVITLSMAVSVYATEYKEDTMLESGEYSGCTIEGSSDINNPVIITVPEEGISVSDAFTIESGYVEFTGGLIYSETTGSMIVVNSGTALSLN